MTQDKNDDSKSSKKNKKPTDNSKSDDEYVGDDALRLKIQKALQNNLDVFAKKRNLSKKQITTINAFVEEHLSSFIILGYSVSGEPVTVINAKTSRDSDALGTLLQKFITKYIDPPHQPPPLY